MVPARFRHDGPATRAESGRTPARRWLVQRLLLIAVAVGVVTGGLSTVGGTYAMWADQAELDGDTVTTGTAALTAEWSGEKDADSWQDLVPGDQVQRGVTLSNTGDVPLTVEASSVSAEFAVQQTGPELVLEPGQSVMIAIELTATNALAPTSESSVEVQFDGRQTR